MVHLTYDSPIAAFMAESFGQSLRGFSLFDDSHRILCATLETGYSISYRTREKQTDLTQTRVDLNIKNQIGYLIHIFIEKDKRGGGHGTSLYNCIESFFIEQECERIILTPSGTMSDGREKSEWWRNRGFQFREKNPNEMEKMLVYSQRH